MEWILLHLRWSPKPLLKQLVLEWRSRQFLVTSLLTLLCTQSIIAQDGFALDYPTIQVQRSFHIRQGFFEGDALFLVRFFVAVRVLVPGVCRSEDPGVAMTSRGRRWHHGEPPLMGPKDPRRCHPATRPYPLGLVFTRRTCRTERQVVRCGATTPTAPCPRPPQPLVYHKPSIQRPVCELSQLGVGKLWCVIRVTLITPCCRHEATMSPCRNCDRCEEL